MREKILRNRKLIIIFMAIFVAISMNISLNLNTKNIEGGFILRNIIRINNSFEFDNLKTIILFIGTIFIFNKAFLKETKTNRKIHKIILSILFTIFCLIGESYLKTNSWDLLFCNVFQIVKAGIVGIGYYIIFRAIINIIFDCLIDKIVYKESKNKLFNFIFEKHSFIMPIIIILICWFPYIIAYYPGIIMQDSREQIKQFYGIQASGATNSVQLIDENMKITNHHPVVMTVILGAFTKFGHMIGNDNFGIFLYTILQMSLLAISFSCIINYMKRMKTPNYIRFITLLIFSILPVFPFYAVKITKDVIFSALIIIYVIELHKMVKKSERKEKYTIKNMVCIILLLLSICLSRNNGIYNILLSFPFLMMIDKINRKKIALILISVICIYKGYTNIVLPAFKISNSSIREMLSIPFQQTARYVKENKENVTDEEKAIIDKVLIYDTLEKRYNPVHADAVKNKYNKFATKQDLSDYFKVWFSQFKKSPTIYMEATINNYYGYFYPNCKATSYIASYSINNDTELSKSAILDYSYNNKKESRKIINNLLKLLENTPIISLFVNIGFNTWIILASVAFLIYKRKYRYLIVYMPVLSILLVCLASPVNAYFRYAMPYLFAMPLSISMLLDIVNKNDGKD